MEVKAQVAVDLINHLNQDVPKLASGLSMRDAGLLLQASGTVVHIIETCCAGQPRTRRKKAA